jgi:hypothetical protein
MGQVFNFTPRLPCPLGNIPGIHWTGDWMGPNDALDALAKRKISCPCRKLNPDSSDVHPLWGWLVSSSVCLVKELMAVFKETATVAVEEHSASYLQLHFPACFAYFLYAAQVLRTLPKLLVGRTWRTIHYSPRLSGHFRQEAKYICITPCTK